MTGTLTSPEYDNARLWANQIPNANRRDSRKTATSLPLVFFFSLGELFPSPDITASYWAV